MNIFVLHQSAPLAAKMHCDKHVVKMTLETAQILATVHHIHGNGANVTYKPTHENHPCVVWAAASLANYRWLLTLGQYLAREYKLRYGKYHACTDLFAGELSKAPPALNKMPSVPFALCMPDECKTDDAVESYRNYYRHKLDTTDWMSWDRAGGAPMWLNSPEFA